MNYGIALLLGSLEVGTMDYFIKILWILLGFAVLGAVLYIVSRFMRISYMRDTLLDIRVEAFQNILNTSYKNFNKKSREAYISNLINDINIFENNFFLMLINLIFRVGVYITSLVILFFIDFKFALGIFVISIILLLINKIFEKKTIDLQEEVSNYNEEFSIEVSNTFNGLEILKLNNLEDKFLNKSLDSINRLERKKFHFTIFTDIQSSTTMLIGYFILVGILIYLLTLIEKGKTYATIIFMFQLSNSSVWSMVNIPPLLNQLKSSSNIYKKITKSTDEILSINKGNKSFSFNKEIEVRNLSFKYDERKIFKDISFKIERGKKYLLKGASGSGKSTLIKLLSKTYDGYSGHIRVDGVDYKDIDENSLNRKLAFIYQDVFLFEDSILNNITLYKSYSHEQISKAINEAGLNKLIRNKERGLEEILWENGKNLSGGERQRISIARAIIKDSEILFIDEATSSLDEELGRHIESTILGLDNTVIAISHRYYEGITEGYDYILELIDGNIVQYSTEEYFQEVAII